MENRPYLWRGLLSAGDGLSWGRISDILNQRIEGWGVAGSSPRRMGAISTLGQLNANMTVIVVSPYDLNEYFLCDFRSEVVPFKQDYPRPLGKRSRLVYSANTFSISTP